MLRSRIAVTICALFFGSSAAAQEEGTVPGAIPDPSTYQGSMEMQQQSDAQDQAFRAQQQQQSEQPQYSQPQSSYGSSQSGGSYGSPAPRSSQQRMTASRQTPSDTPLMAAFHRGDYATCLKMLRPRVAAGDASAESNLGFMYEKGLGVPRNPAAAVSLYRKAANQGHPPGQFALGRLYYEGVGLQRDLVEAYKWMYLAGRKYSRAYAYLHVIGNMLTYDQMSEALRRGQMWTPVGVTHH